MIPQKDQHVRCFMRTGMVLEGIVEEWTPGWVVLKSLDEKSRIIVHKPEDDIMLTKIVLTEEPQEKPAKKPELPEIKQRVKEKLEEVLQPTNDEDLDKMNLKQLGKLVIEQEKKIISDKIKEHFGSPHTPKKSAYAPSGNIAILAAKQEAAILRKHFGRKK